IVWAGLCLVMIPVFMMAWGGKELAPMEDQGVVFGIVEGPPNASIEQTTFYADAVNQLFEKVPETGQTFQLTFPDSGFSGMVLKPWGERKRTALVIQPEAQMMVNTIPGIRLFMVTPP